MDLILSSADGREERTVWDDFDIEIGQDNTFQVSLDYSEWDGSFDFGKMVYVPYTEYGGIIKDIQGQTESDKIYVRGYTWRGYLAHRIIEPPSGQDYRKVSGELNEVIASLLDDSLGGLFTVSSEDTGVSVSNYQIDRYTTLDAGLTKMLQSVGYRLDIQYKQTASSGYVEISAQPAIDYGDDIEISQDSRLDFSSEDYRMGVNHLICLGTGELAERLVIHLYADADGNISQTKSISGLEEIVDIYDNPGAEEDTLLEMGTERFKELLNFKRFEADVKELDDLDLPLGDTITGRDYITGNVVTKPIVSKIIKRENGVVTIEHDIEGEM